MIQELRQRELTAIAPRRLEMMRAQRNQRHAATGETRSRTVTFPCSTLPESRGPQISGVTIPQALCATSMVILITLFQRASESPSP